jgi:hypothetical protein
MNADVFVLEWRFSPGDYFEEPITISRSNYSMVIDGGKAKATIDGVIFDAKPSMREILHEALNDRFLAAQLISRQPYTLSKSSVTRIDSKGRRHVSVEAEPEHLKISGGVIDVRVTGKNGTVIHDSASERIKKRESFADLAEKYSANDPLVRALLKSYGASVRDPNNELVHLYEIRDALSTKFGGKQATLSTLGIAPSHWSRLGQLCNDEPLRQGRHRGENTGALRDATESELVEVRRIGRSMVEAYLRYLENLSHAP